MHALSCHGASLGPLTVWPSRRYGLRRFRGPGFAGSYQVTRATLSLQLRDGRVAVVNCASKANWTDRSTMNANPSCRVPLVNTIRAEFDGDHAKLKWSVSLDGKNMELETYKILAVLERP